MIRSLFDSMLLLAMVAVFGSGCGTGPDAEPKPSNSTNPEPAKVQLLLNWYPEAEHGGYYAAEVHGYYAEAGLKVEIIPGGPNSPVLQQVAGRSVTFGIENADRVLLGRSVEADVLAVMAPIQTSPRCLMVHLSSGISRFNDLRDVTLAVSSGSAWVEFLKKSVSLENVRIVPYTGSVAQFLVDKQYAQQAYVFSEPFVAKQGGADPYCLMVSELGYNPYTSLLITHRETVQSSPDVVRKMTEATIRGWRKYLEDPQKANRYISGKNPQMELDILEYGARALKPLCLTGEVTQDQLGLMTSERWRKLADQLVEVGVLKSGSVDPAQAFTTQFLPVAD